MTKIYAMTHKKFTEPEDPIYIPLQVGREGKEDLGYLCDNTGDHISDLNCYYGELTGVYWLWRNLPEEEQNIGICHYRRFFTAEEDGHLLTEQEYEKILSEYDIITSKAIDEGMPYRDYYAEAHNIRDLELEGEVIKKLYPEDYPVWEQVMAQPTHYYGNLCVTSQKLFNEYASWLFNIFAELGEYVDVSSYDEYHRRLFGFLSEQLLMVWIRARGLKVYECRVGMTQEKAETIELKLALGQLVKQKQITEARQLLYQYVKLRPDVMLPHSDVLGELPIIDKLLYTMEAEQKAGVKGLLDKSTDLRELIKYYKETIEK